jgi:exodeoxyribonuclease VII large subunit
MERHLRELDLRLRLSRTRHRLEAAVQRSGESMRMRLARSRGQFEPLAAQLTQLSPLRILERGYAIVQDETGRLVKDASTVPVDTDIGVRLARGRLGARVTESIRDT